MKPLRLLALLLAALGPAAQAATLASSTFDSGTDGWTVVDLPYPSPGAPPVVLGTAAPGWNAAGYATLQDISANAWYWSAPAAYLGDRSNAVGGALSWQVAVTGNGFGATPWFSEEDVILVGAGRTLVHDTGLVILPTQAVTWHTLTVGQQPGQWRLGSNSGALASAADLQAVLGSLSALYVRGEYLFGLDDVGRLDNVVLTAVPEPGTWLLMLTGVAWLARRPGSRR